MTDFMRTVFFFFSLLRIANDEFLTPLLLSTRKGVELAEQRREKNHYSAANVTTRYFRLHFCRNEGTKSMLSMFIQLMMGKGVSSVSGKIVCL